jgi:inosose dehydratase
MIRFGCQTYTWQMSYDAYKNRLSDILDTIEQSAFKGVEAEVCMLGKYYAEPGMLKEALDQRGLQLAALTLAEPWLGPQETDAERARADQLIAYLKRFPEAKLIVCQLPGRNREERTIRQRHAIAAMNAVARRAAYEGIDTACHPNSPDGSVFRTEEDYKVLLGGLDHRYIGFCPDSGHIAKGGMDVYEVFRANLSIIRHVHFKDYSIRHDQWCTMGQGELPHPALTELLRSNKYQGWIMVEEESSYAEAFPDGATMQNGAYVTDQLTGGA